MIDASMELILVQKEYRSLDVMKLVMAVVVVAIHTRPEMSFSSAFIRRFFEIIYSLAVPFFFMGSGFLLFRKVELPLNVNGSKRILGYLFRICRLYLLWTVIYLPLTIYGFYIDGVPPLKALAAFARNVLLIGENYLSWPLWYLLALIVAVGIIHVLLKLKVSSVWVLIFSVLMACVGVGLDYCHEKSIMNPIIEIYFSIFLKTRNGFFVGFLYVALGMFCATIERIQIKFVLLLFMIGCVAECLKLPLSNAFIVFTLFVATVSFQVNGLSGSSNFRLMSSIVYFCHMLFVAMLKLLCGMNPSCKLFLMVAMLSLLTGLCIIRNKETRFVKFLFK